MNKALKKEEKVNLKSYVFLIAVALFLILLTNSVNATDLTLENQENNELQIKAEWTNDTNAVSYQLYIDGIQVLNGMTLDYMYTAGDTNEHTFTVSSYNSTNGLIDTDSGNATASDNTTPQEVIGLYAEDTENDQGTAIDLHWTLPSDDGQGINYIDHYLIKLHPNGSCTNNNYNDSVSAGISSFTWENLEVNTTYGFKVTSVDASGNENESSCINATTIDNNAPDPPTNVNAADHLDDQGELGIDINWTRSADEPNVGDDTSVAGGDTDDVLGYYIYAATAESGMNYTNIVSENTHWNYTSPAYISFRNVTTTGILGSSSLPWNVSSYYNTTLFYFYITAWDGTQESDDSAIVTAAFNAEPYFANDTIYLDPLKGHAQTAHDIYCTGFVCDGNNDEITAKYTFTVATFSGGTNYVEENMDATCINLGPIGPNDTIPQYPNLNDIYCEEGIVDNPDLWECTAMLSYSHTFKGDKITCAMVPNDGKEDGPEISSGENSDTRWYAINNTAPYASNAEVTPTDPLGNDTLTCNFTFNDIDLDTESEYGSVNDKSTAYKWYINNEGINSFVEVPDETNPTLDNYFDQNDKIKCAISVCDYDESWVSNPLCYNERVWFNSTSRNWTWLNGSTYYEYENSSVTIIGGNSIPQLIDYEDDSNSTNPTNVGEDVTFDSHWLDTDVGESAMMVVCDKTGGIEDYSCDNDTYCAQNITFGGDGNFAHVYTNETGLMIDTVDIKIRQAIIDGITNSTSGYNTPFIFSIIAYEADNTSMTDSPTSHVPDYYGSTEMRIARSDWNTFTVGEWTTFTMQYNAQPLPDKYTSLKFCIADPNDPAFSEDMEMGGVGYATARIQPTGNWLMDLINWVGKAFRTIFGITGKVADSGYLDNCLLSGEIPYNDSSVKVAAHETGSASIIYDNTSSDGGPHYDQANIRINYKASGSDTGSCPGAKTYCETDYSPDKQQSCTYTAEDVDDSEVIYHMRICDVGGACSIWRDGNFTVNHAAKLNWVNIGTNHLSYNEGLTYTSDINDDWNLQCIQGTGSDQDLTNTTTSDIMIDADGWETPFADIRNQKDSNLKNGTAILACSNDTNLAYIDVNDDSNYNYNIDTLIYNNSENWKTILQFSSVSSGTNGTSLTGCYFHDTNENDNYDSGEDIIWDATTGNSVYNEIINYTYEWFVKPFGDTEFSSCDDFLWCDNDYNDILVHGNTMPGDEWKCQITPIDEWEYGESKNSSEIHVTAALGEDIPETGGGPEITAVSDNSNNESGTLTPINIGDDIIVNVTWDGPYDYVKLYVCDNDTHIRNSGCWGYEFNRTVTYNNPAQAIFKVDELVVTPGTNTPVFNLTNSHGPINYNLLFCSADYDCRNQSGYSFFVNHIPIVNSLNITYYNNSAYVSGNYVPNDSTIKCAVNDSTDSDNDTMTYTYKWWLKRSGDWQVYWQYGPTSNTSNLLSFSATELGDQWKCEIIPNDGYSDGTSKTSDDITISESTGTETETSVVNATDNSNATYPTNVGEDITFIISWASPNTTSAMAYICNSSNILQTGCAAGSKQFSYSGWTTDNPLTITYTAEDEDYGDNTNHVLNYYTMVCNENYDCSSAEGPYNFSVNHIPTAETVSINGGAYINETDDLSCNYTFDDGDHNVSGGGNNSSDYHTESDQYFSWYKKVQGVWVKQDFSTQTISTDYTSYGDEWKCEVIVNDGYANSTAVSAEGIVESHAPTIQSTTYQGSNSSEPITFNENITFTVDWSDPEQWNDAQVTLFICNDSSITSAGCSNTEYCTTTFTTTDPITCEFNSSTLTTASANTTQFNYTMRIYDEDENSDTETGTIHLNRKPEVTEVNLTPTSPQPSNNLECSATANDAENATLTYNYSWYYDQGSGFQLLNDYPNNETLVSGETSLGQRWKCTVTTCDNYTCSVPVDSDNVTVTQYGVNETPKILSLDSSSTATEPTNVGDVVTFAINWTDADQPFGELVEAYVCKNDSIIENAGCEYEGFTEVDFTSDNPIYASYTVQSTDNGTVNFTVMICDDSNLCSSANVSTFSVNHVPTAQNTSIINSSGGTFFNTNETLNCNYTFSDADFNLSGDNTNASNYAGEEDQYFFWYKYNNGTWQNIDADTSVQNLSSDHTAEGESWKCGVIVSDGYVNSTENISSEIPIGEITPEITSVALNTNSTAPLVYEANINFTVNWYDSNIGETVELFICNSTNHNREGCLDTAFCTLSSTSTSPYTCTYDSENLNNNITNQSYYVYIYDSTERSNNYNSLAQNNNIYINHLPTLDSANLTVYNSTPADIYPLDNETLNCSYTNLTDLDSDNEMFNNTSITYRWYVDQGSGYFEWAVTTGSILTHEETLAGDYWKCGLTPYDDTNYGEEVFSEPRYIYDYEVSGTTPNITEVMVDSNSTNPTNVGEEVTFSISWTDADQPFGENVTVYICDEQGRYENGGCINAYIQAYAQTTNPITLTYTTTETDLSTSNYSIQIVDSDGQVSNYDNDSFAVNHKPNATTPLTIQIDEETLHCNFTYHESTFTTDRNDSEITNAQSDIYSFFEWYEYLNSNWTQLSETSRNLTMAFTGGEVIRCRVLVGDQWELTDTDFKNASNTTVIPAPTTPTLWPLDALNNNNAQITGYLPEDNVNNITIQAYAWQGYANPKDNSTTTLSTSTLKGTSAVIDTFETNSSFVVINNANHTHFNTTNYIEFANHDKEDFLRYQITEHQEIIPDESYRINISPVLNQTVPTGTIVYAYNSSEPQGWFNFTLNLHADDNTIKARAIKTIEGGYNLTGDWTSAEETFSDNENPAIGINDIPNYETSTTPTISFNLTDNYGINLPTLLLNITGTQNKTHVTSDTSYNTTEWSNLGDNISCTPTSSTNYDCQVVLNLTSGTYNLTFNINDSAENTFSTTKSNYWINSSPAPSEEFTVVRTTPEFNNTNLTFNVSIPQNISSNGTLQYTIGTAVYPNTGWNSITGWRNLTSFGTDEDYISYSNISSSWTNLSLYTNEDENLTLTPHTIYVANVRYQIYNWSLWSDVKTTQAMKYFPPYDVGTGPTAVNVTAPLYSFSPTIPISWTGSSDDKYDISYYVIAAGTAEYNESGWNDTQAQWLNAGNTLTHSLEFEANELTHQASYYFTIAAVNTIGKMSTPISSFGTTYYDQTPPTIEINSVANDTDSSDGWLDTNEDDITLINITADENSTCYYSLYDQDYADRDSTKGDKYCNATTEIIGINLTCNITDEDDEPLTQGNHTYYIICQDDREIPNEQSRDENTEINFTVNWPDEPVVDNLTIDIAIYTSSANERNLTNPAYALTNDVLFCNYISSDLDGNGTVDDSLTQYKWYIDGTEITGQTTDYLDLSVNGSAGDNIICEVNITDTTGLSSGFIQSNHSNFNSTVYINNSIPTTATQIAPINNTWHTDSIDFDWTDSTDADEDGINYTLYIYNSSEILESSNETSDSNITINLTDYSDNNYTWYIKSCDNSSFTNNCTESINLTFKVDQTSPTIDITSPTEDQSVGILVEFWANITDTLNQVVDYPTYEILNSSNETIASGFLISLNNQYYASWIPTGFTSGNYSIVITANDSLGNSGNSTRNFALDLLAPYIVVDPDEWEFRAQWLNNNSNLIMDSFVNSTNTTFGSPLNYSVNLSYNIYKTGTIIKTNSTENTSETFWWNHSIPLNTPDWTDGRYDVVFNVTDTLNNTVLLETWFVVDKTAPEYANQKITTSSNSSTVYNDDNVTLSIDWLNNMFIWDANENNIDKDRTTIIWTYNTSNSDVHQEMNLSSETLEFLDDTFFGTIPENETNKTETIYWKSISYDLAGNMRDTSNSSTNETYWFSFTVASETPVFNSTIADISWPEDTDYTNLTLSDYFSDADDNLTHTYTMYPKGLLLYDSLNNLTEIIDFNNGSYENINQENGINNNSILIQSEIENLLLNGDFNESTEDAEHVTTPQDWVRHSYPVYTHNAPPEYVTVNEHNYYSQLITVTENTNYTLSQYMATNSTQGNGRLHINWFNELYPTDETTNKTISYLGSTLDCESSQNCSGIIAITSTPDINESTSRRILTLTSPQESAYAQIVIDSDSNSTWVKIDKVQFEQKEYASTFLAEHRLPGKLTYPITSQYNVTRNNFNKEEGTIEMFIKPTWNGSETLNEDAVFFDIRLDEAIEDATPAVLTSGESPYIFTITANATPSEITGTAQEPFSVTPENNLFKVNISGEYSEINLSENPLIRIVLIQNLALTNLPSTIEAGTITTFTNLDDATYNISFTGPENLSTEDLSYGESFTHLFPTAGVYNYSFTLHPEVNGTFTVTEKTDYRNLTAEDVKTLLDMNLDNEIVNVSTSTNNSIKLETIETGSTKFIQILNGTANELLGFTNQIYTGADATTDNTLLEITISGDSYNISFSAGNLTVDKVVETINTEIPGLATADNTTFNLTTTTDGSSATIFIGDESANDVLGFTSNETEEGIDAVDDLFWLGRKDNKFVFGIREREDKAEINITNLNNQEWTFVAARWDEDTISLTINNEITTDNRTTSEELADIDNTTFNDLTIYIGSNGAQTEQANAYIDELAIYDYARSDTDLLNDYNNNSTIYLNGTYTTDGEINTTINESDSNNVTTTFSPFTDWFGYQRIRFFVNDSFTKIASNLLNLYVTPVNDAPRKVFGNETIENQSWWMDNSHTLDLSNYFHDIEDDELTYYEIYLTANYKIKASINGSIVTFTQPTGWNGEEKISFNVTDGEYWNSSNNIALNVYLNRIYNTTIDETDYNDSYGSDGTDLTTIYLAEIYDSTIYKEDTNLTTINESFINLSTIDESIIINDSTVFNSTINDSTLIRTTVLNSDIIHVTLTDTYVDGAFIDPSNVTNSNVTGSSRIIDSNVTDSNINNSNVTNSEIDNSDLYYSSVDLSTISNLILRYANVTNDFLNSGAVYNSDDEELWNTTNNGTTPLANITNYPPIITYFSLTESESQNNTYILSFRYNDSNLNYSFPDNITWTINWGEGTTSEGTNSSNPSESFTDSNTYSSSGNYTVTLTITDLYEQTVTQSETITITISSGTTQPSGGGGGNGLSGSTVMETIETCTDGIKNQDEMGIDCGGVCAACPGPTCYDGIKNQNEAGVDCGGPCYTACSTATCSDNIKNQGEEGVDCGGPCSACTVRATCSDNIQNQGEEGVDCGGPCSKCTTCSDYIQNQGEEGVDCGGPCSKCPKVEQPLFGIIPLNLIPYLIAIIVVLVAIIGFVLRGKLLPPKRPEIKPAEIKPTLIPVEGPAPITEQKPIKESKQEIKPAETKPKLKPVEQPSEEDKFKDLKKYVSTRLANGFNKNHIKQTLIIKGWPEEVLDVALDGSKELKDTLSTVENYINSSYAEGYNLEEIRQSLLEQGWSEGITDLLLFNVHKPHQDTKQLKAYINYKLSQGKTADEVKQLLQSVGWGKEVIDSVI